MTSEPLQPTPELPVGAVTLRRGLLTFLGAIVAAASGLLIAVAVGRGLGPTGAGVFFTIVAGYTIASTVLKFGADTAQLWRLPRLLVEGRTSEIRRTVVVATLPAVVGSAVVALIVIVQADALGGLVAPSAPEALAPSQLIWASLALAAMAPMSILVAVTRGLGRVGPFVWIQNIGLPVGRLVCVVTVLLLGAGGVAVMAAWSAPVVVSLAVATVLALTSVRAVVGRSPARLPPRPVSSVVLEMARYAGPRGATASLESTMVGANTLMVAFLAGPAAAGIFGALSRFVTSGPMADQAVRILVAPRFSALLAARDVKSADRLYSATTPWIVLVSWPLFVTLALGSTAVLSIFGDGFDDGAVPLAVLAVTLCVTQLAGNVHTVLLMSGHSSLQLLNKAVAVAFLIVANLIAIPRWGLIGASVAWSASLVVDTLLAVIQVRRRVGLSLKSTESPRVAVVALVVFGIPVGVSTHLLDRGVVGLLASLLLSIMVYLAVLWHWRARLHLDSIKDTTSIDARPDRGAVAPVGSSAPEEFDADG